MQCQMEPQDHIDAVHSSHNTWSAHTCTYTHVHTHSTYTIASPWSSRQYIIVVKGLDSGDRLPKFKPHFSHLLVVYVKPWQVCWMGWQQSIFHRIVEMVKWVKTQMTQNSTPAKRRYYVNICYCYDYTAFFCLRSHVVSISFMTSCAVRNHLKRG